MTKEQVTVDPAAMVEGRWEGSIHEVAPDLAYQCVVLVNVVFIGPKNAGDRQWVLVDAGVMGTAETIASSAEARFGKSSRPAAILLTHGHFDHVGALEVLADRWDAPIYAHDLEFPYLNGQASYPLPDSKADPGMMAALSPLYPRGPIDVSKRLQSLPMDHSVPHLAGWKWIPAPGHTPGQVALWREADRALLSADAVITTKQESAYAVLTQSAELHGPPMYFTQDWGASRETVKRLAALHPELLIAGHGRAMHGGAMRKALQTLADDFDEVAVPKQGEYVDRPATAESGTAYQRKPR